MAPARSRQRTAPGFGEHFVSPKKVRDPKKTTTQSVVPGQAAKHQKLLAKLKALQNPIEPPPEDTHLIQSQDVDPYPSDPDSGTGQQPDINLASLDQVEDGQPYTTNQRRLVPDATAFRLYSSWNGLIRSLVRPFLEYLTVSAASVHPPTGDIHSTCRTTACAFKTTNITALFFDRVCPSSSQGTFVLTYFSDFKTVSVTACSCQSIASVLVRNGLFPTAPTQPRIAVSIHLLDFYRALFERSCDAVNAVVSALHTFYKQRGFNVLDKEVSYLPFCEDPIDSSIGQSHPRSFPPEFWLCDTMARRTSRPC